MGEFRIAAAQVASRRGDVATNIAAHEVAIAAAARHAVSVLIFPELSLIGYEPDLAAELQLALDDERLNDIATLAKSHQIDVVVGAPLKSGSVNPNLGAIVFGADGSRPTYSKMHLGSGERARFTPGDTPVILHSHGHRVGLSICADSSRPEHPKTYSDAGAGIYAAGVFLNAEWFATDSPRLAKYSEDFGMLVVMANQADSIGTYQSVGRSAVWSPDGTLLAEARGTESCLVIATFREGAWHGEVARL